MYGSGLHFFDYLHIILNSATFFDIHTNSASAIAIDISGINKDTSFSTMAFWWISTIQQIYLQSQSEASYSQK